MSTQVFLVNLTKEQLLALVPADGTLRSFATKINPALARASDLTNALDWLSVKQNAVPASLTISGTDTIADGDYLYAGVTYPQDGVPQNICYSKDDCLVFANVFGETERWTISATDGVEPAKLWHLEATYSDVAPVALPPVTGWGVSTTGDAAPTITLSAVTEQHTEEVSVNAVLLVGGHGDNPLAALNLASGDARYLTPTAADLRYALAAEVPVSKTSDGIKGQIAVDTNYVYVCVATNVWQRSTLADWE